jgi:hypothetical protein
MSAVGQMKASTTRQPLKCDSGMHCLYFSNAADELRQKQAWFFGL